MSAAAAALATGALVSVGLVATSIGVGASAPPGRGGAAARRRRTDDGRLVAAIVVGLVVLLVTRWVVAALASAVLVAAWRHLSGDDDAEERRRVLEGVARWLDDLRDVVRRSSIPIEDALEIVAERPPAALAAALGRFGRRRRQGVPLDESLVELADAIDHPTADSAIAALLLVTHHGAGGGRVHDTLDELAHAARAELSARREIDRTRRTYRRSMRRLVLLVVAIVVGLWSLSGDLLEPYRSPAGQVWLLVPVAVWAAALLWLRRLVRDERLPRRRLRVQEALR